MPRILIDVSQGDIENLKELAALRRKVQRVVYNDRSPHTWRDEAQDTWLSGTGCWPDTDANLRALLPDEERD